MKTLVPWRTRQLAPWADFENLEQRMRRMLGRAWPETDVESALAWAPAIDLKELDGTYEVTAELPGIKPEQVEVTVENNMLTIRGEKKEEETKEEEGKWHVFERCYGSFERSFTLPRGVDESKVQARFDNGILKVTLPKTVVSKGKKIKIEG